MERIDYQRIIAELDTLAEQVAGTMQRFEATGFTSVMKDDYVVLHVLQHRILEMRLEHTQAMGRVGTDIELSARH